MQASAARARMPRPRMRSRAERAGARDVSARETPSQRFNDLIDRDAAEAPLLCHATAAALVVTRAGFVARDRNVLLAPGTIAAWIRGTKERHGRDTKGRSDVERTCISRHDQPRMTGE